MVLGLGFGLGGISVVIERRGCGAMKLPDILLLVMLRRGAEGGGVMLDISIALLKS